MRAIKNASASVAINAVAYNSRVVPVLGYQAQFLIPPPNLPQIESAALHGVFRLPNNCFRHRHFFDHESLGIPKIRSAYVACLAALFRTASKTLPNWSQWLIQLNVAAHELMPMALWGKGLLCHPFWDSQPFAANLAEAFSGFPNLTKATPGGRALLKDIADKNGGAMPSPGSPFFRNHKALQKAAYNILLDNTFDVQKPENKLTTLIQERLVMLFQPWDIDFDTVVQLDACMSCVSALPGTDRIKIFKNWTNGWVTSYRMHEDNRHNCLLGCRGAPDCQAHYLQCPHLFALVNFFWSGTSANPLARWGLINPTIQTLNLNCCAFSAYHAVKAQIRMQGTCIINGNDGHVCSSLFRGHWSLFADSFRAEAGERGIQVRPFSLPSFLQFICHNSLTDLS